MPSLSWDHQVSRMLMMSVATFILFCSTALAAVLTPGPATVLAVRNGVNHGWRWASFSSLGNISGLLLLSGASAIGVGALLKSSATVFLVFKLVGAAYLVYLGARQCFTRGKAVELQMQEDDHAPARLYREGLCLALTNPNAIIFITALFPQFIVSGKPLLPQFWVLTLTFMALSFTVLMLYASMGQLARGSCVRCFKSGAFRRVTGGAFIVLGLGMLRL